MYKHFFKRLLDFVISLSAIIFLFPLFIVLTIILYFNNKKVGVFYTQTRPGKNEKKIRIIKFKSMTDEVDLNGKLLPDSKRLTKTGRIIRSTSLDELPQLFNVLKGDMSLIGPRPLLFDYIPLYNNEQKRRHEIRPGITGWAQVNGRNTITWTQKFKYDIWYVDNVSFLLDLKIIIKTITNVLSKKDTEFTTKEGIRRFNGTN